MIVIPATRDEAFETQSDRFCRLWSFDFFVVIVSVDIFAILTRRLNILGDRCHFFLSWTITVDNTHIFRNSKLDNKLRWIRGKMRINFTNNGMEWYARIHAITIIHAYNTDLSTMRITRVQWNFRIFADFRVDTR